MTNQAQSVFANASPATVTVVTTAETVIATTRAVTSPYAGASFWIEFIGEFVAGTSATSGLLRIRRDSVTGSVVYLGNTLGWAPATRQQFAVAWIDTLIGDVAGQSWVLTIVQAGAVANGTATNMSSKVIPGV